MESLTGGHLCQQDVRGLSPDLGVFLKSRTGYSLRPELTRQRVANPRTNVSVRRPESTVTGGR
eukprot:15309316-Alexandrium_andersonii.AAC.1